MNPHGASSKIPWVVIVGPTAVGKTAVAELLALDLQTEIIVADSRQVYQGMDIGTNKPSPEAKKRVPRYLIDLIPPDQSFSAGCYKREAEAKVGEMEKQQKPIFIEGGTGLYIKTLLYGLWSGPPANWGVRQGFFEKEKEGGEGTLHRLLREVDPTSAQKIHFRDLSKIVRALEVYTQTGRPLSSFHEEHRFNEPIKAPCLIVGLRRERKDLYRRIEMRVDQQIGAGLIEETERFLSAGLDPTLSSMRGLGYKQMIPYVRGEETLEKAVSVLKRDTRRYAKRQMTWFQGDPNIEWIDMREGESAEATSDRIKNLKNYKIVL